MNSFELNKILGAILGTCLVLLALNIAAGAYTGCHRSGKPVSHRRRLTTAVIARPSRPSSGAVFR